MPLGVISSGDMLECRADGSNQINAQDRQKKWSLQIRSLLAFELCQINRSGGARCL